MVRCVHGRYDGERGKIRFPGVVEQKLIAENMILIVYMADVLRL